jgi:hypothetical protein
VFLNSLLLFLNKFSLSDCGMDNLYDSVPISIALENASLGNQDHHLIGRRFRLVCMCLHTLDSLDPVNLLDHQQMVMTVMVVCRLS